MAIRKIVTVGDPVLRKKSRPVVNFDEKLACLLDDMRETMDKAEGAGLAAVQVGILRRAIVINVGDGYMELINPEIIETSGEQEDSEGCLSLPGKWGLVKRPNYVKLRAQNRKGQWRLYEGTGLKARCFCHEIDHLEGILYTDKQEKTLTAEEVRRRRQGKDD
ncbi:MAG: peptide deformylase [Oscillospiraceae bacterium]|nr:peptide deformylase [Oscillospiraceae bacterium]MDD6146315.1 peptide deformylase [Oscillospiraceae bacterium]